MVDLAEAGARLRELRLDDPPPVATLERRTTRRTRRRRMVGRGVAGGFVAVVVATAVTAAVTLLPGGPKVQRVVTAPPSSTRTTAGPARLLPVVGPIRPLPSASPLPAVHHAPGAKPVDWGRLRLWLPPGWQAQKSAPSCPAANTVYFTAGPGSACVVPPSPNTPVPYVQVEPFTAAPPAGSKLRVINGVAAYVEAGSTNQSAGFVTEDVPSLGVRLVVEGAGASVAATLGRSSYAAVSDATYPVAVPASWKTVIYEGFQVHVPASWPVRTLGLHLAAPGFCGLGGGALAIYLGREEVVPTCPAPPPGYVPPLGNYLWMQPYTASGGSLEQRLRTGRLTLTLQETLSVDDYTETANLTASSGNRRISLTVGLGAEPTTAEAVLSSIRPA